MIDVIDAKVIEIRNTTANHFKFYRVVRAGRNRTVNLYWGRIGSRGQRQRLVFPSAVEATSFILDKIESKLNRGYRITSLATD